MAFNTTSLCPCGLTGDSCRALLSGLLEPAASNFSCSQFGTCSVVVDKAVCVCDCGYQGLTCSEPIVALKTNLIIMTVLACVLSVASVLFAYAKSKRAGSFRSFEIPAVHCVHSASKHILVEHGAAFRVFALLIMATLASLVVVTQIYQHRSSSGFFVYTLLGGILQVLYFSFGALLSLAAVGELPSHAGLQGMEKGLVVLAHSTLAYTFAMTITSLSALTYDFKIVNDALQVAFALEHVLQLGALVLDVVVFSQIPHDSDHATYLGVFPAVLVLVQAIVHLVDDANKKPSCGAPLLAGPDSPYYLGWIVLFVALHYLGFAFFKLLVHLRHPLLKHRGKTSNGSMTTARI